MCGTNPKNKKNTGHHQDVKNRKHYSVLLDFVDRNLDSILLVGGAPPEVFLSPNWQ
jgi:hypothetical protein